MAKYLIHMQDGFEPPREDWYQEVEGEPFVVPGWEEFKLFWRRANPNSAFDVSFIVSEVTTGYQLGEIYISQEQAVADLTKRFERKGREAIRAMVKEYRIPEGTTVS